MESDKRAEQPMQPWQTPRLEVRGDLLDITAASASVGANDTLFSDGPSGG